MEVTLVRHACAGRKRDWTGPDVQRPIDRVGLEQAAAVADFLEGRRVTRLLASPALRCQQTLQPLAVRRGLTIEASRHLRPDAAARGVLALLTTPDNDGAVLCTHGETMTSLLKVLARMRVSPKPGNRNRILQKGSIWVFTVEPARRPRIVKIEHHLPAGLRQCQADAFHAHLA